MNRRRERVPRYPSPDRSSAGAAAGADRDRGRDLLCSRDATSHGADRRGGGLVLTGINEGDSLVHRHVSRATGIKMALILVVPFAVSNLGVLAGTRRG